LRAGGEVAVTVGGTRHCQRTFNKENERKRKGNERNFHVLTQSYTTKFELVFGEFFLSLVMTSAYRDKDIASISSICDDGLSSLARVC